jgi:hypothetical protein
MKKTFILMAILFGGCKNPAPTPVPTDAATPEQLYEMAVDSARANFADQFFPQSIEAFERARSLRPLPENDLLFLSIACLQNNDYLNALRYYKELLANGYVYKSEKDFDNDPQFYLFHEQPEWEELKKLAYANIKNDRAAAKNKKLRAALDKLADKRETLRHEVEDLYNDSLALKEQLAVQDSSNSLFVMQNTDKLGWPGKTLVGKGGAKAAAFMLQLGDASLTEKYLPLMRAASVQGELDSADLVTFEDKMLVAQGKPQVYATQLHSNGMALYPTEDFDNVNKRRMALGLYPYIMKYAPPMSLPDSLANNEDAPKKD